MTRGSWYVVQSKPLKEAVVCAQLTRFSDEIQYFFPRIRNHLGIRSLFPSYLFVKMIMTNENYHLIKYTRGVLRLIGSRGEGPLSVPEEVIATIQSRMESNGLIDQRKIWSKGQSVKVRKGPLKDLIGILEKPAPDAGRVQVLFRLLKYPLRAVLGFEELELV